MPSVHRTNRLVHHTYAPCSRTSFLLRIGANATDTSSSSYDIKHFHDKSSAVASSLIENITCSWVSNAHITSTHRVTTHISHTSAITADGATCFFPLFAMTPGAPSPNSTPPAPAAATIGVAELVACLPAVDAILSVSISMPSC
jgi:hypothetical protein